MSRRAETKYRRKRRGGPTTLIPVTLVALLAGVALIGLSLPVTTPTPTPVIGERAIPRDADGSAWGPKGAPVLIEEYSDFQ